MSYMYYLQPAAGFRTVALRSPRLVLLGPWGYRPAAKYRASFGKQCLSTATL